MKQSSLHALVALTASALLSLTAGPASAAMPMVGSVEGLLTSSGGGAAADGTYPITFAIYAAETGGSAVWSEGPTNVVVKSGQFTWILGSKTPLIPAGLSLQSAWLGIQISTDPELPRRPLGATLYALRAAVAESLDCSGCVKIGSLDAGVLQPYAKTSDLAPFAKSADLSAYAKAADLAGYAKTTDLGAYAKTTDLSDFVKAAALAKVAGTGSYTDLSNTPTYAKVATTGDYADLKNTPALPTVGKLCGTGLFFKGYNTDGSINCVNLAEGDMPPDGIDEVSNGLINNQFVDSQPGTPDVAIPDGLGAGKSDSLTFPDIGLAQKISIDMTILNSDLTGVKVEVYGPGMANAYVLYDGGKSGTSLTAKFNDDLAIVSGDINKDWIGKNIQGVWSVTVKDTKAGGGAGGLDGKYNWAVSIQTLSSKKLRVKGDLLVDGSIALGKGSANVTQTGLVSEFAGNNWKQCTWTAQGDETDNGPTYAACDYVKKLDTTAIKVEWSGNLRLWNCNGCCEMWTLRVDGKECTVPGRIDFAMYWATNYGNVYSNAHWGRMFGGYCTATADGPIKAGSHKIQLYVQNCDGYGVADAYTGWNSNSRVMIQEVP